MKHSKSSEHSRNIKAKPLRALVKAHMSIYRQKTVLV